MKTPSFRKFAAALVFAVATASVIGATKDPVPKGYYTKENPLWPLERLDEKPVPIEQAPPDSKAMAGLPRGSVVVTYIISKTGDVEFPFISKSTDARLDEPFLVAVRKWRFKPAVKNGKPANCRVSQQLDYN